MDNLITKKELRDYAWAYFSLHAEQRLKTFHFFIIITAFVFTVLTAFIEVINGSIWMSVPMFSISILSYAFWQLDKRNKELVRVGEEALTKLEAELICNDVALELCPFINEHYKTEYLKSQNKSSLSYSQCFGFVFLSFGITCFLLGFYVIFSQA